MYSLRYYELDSKKSSDFLELTQGQKIETKYQLALHGIKDDEAHTAVEFLGMSLNNEYYKYVIRYEEKEDIVGRYLGDPIYYYISYQDLELFRKSSEPSFFIIGSQKKKENALKILEQEGIIKLRRYQIDLIKLKDNLEDIFVVGGWFADLRIDKVRSAGIFGVNVADSQMWNQLQNSGGLSSLTIQLDLKTRPLSITVSSSGNVVYFDKWDENKSLTLAQELTNRIKPFFVYEGESNEKSA